VTVTTVRKAEFTYAEAADRYKINGKRTAPRHNQEPACLARACREPAAAFTRRCWATEISVLRNQRTVVGATVFEQNKRSCLHCLTDKN